MNKKIKTFLDEALINKNINNYKKKNMQKILLMKS